MVEKVTGNPVVRLLYERYECHSALLCLLHQQLCNEDEMIDSPAESVLLGYWGIVTGAVEYNVGEKL